MKVIDDLFIVGTDTGVGKTAVSLLLMRLFFSKGLSPHYLKPFQTGCRHPNDADSDARFIYRHTPALNGLDPGRSVIYCHPDAKAPYYAARDVGQTLSPDHVAAAIAEKKERHSPLVVEAAGGLMVPVTADTMIIDVVRASGCRPLLVARAGLGTINHTLLSLMALRQWRLTPLGVVFVASSPLSASDSARVEENMDAIERFGGVRVGGVIGHVSDWHCPPAAAYRAIEDLLE